MSAGLSSAATSSNNPPGSKSTVSQSEVSWKPNTFQSFHSIISQTDHENLDFNSIARLLRDTSKYFQNLLSEPKSDPASRKELEQGFVEIPGLGRAQVNSDFRTQAILLSSLLDINETKAAIIFDNALRAQSQYDKSPFETAVILYYKERHHLLDSLLVLFSKSSASSEISERIRNLLSQFILDLIDARLPKSFAAQVLGVIQNISEKIQALKEDVVLPGRSYQTGTKIVSTAEQSGFNVRSSVETAIENLLIDQRFCIKILLSMTKLYPRDSVSLLVLDSLKPMSNTDITTNSLLIALLGCLDTVIPSAEGTRMLNDGYIDAITANLEDAVFWKNGLVKAVVCLKWGLVLHQESERRIALGGNVAITEASDKFVNSSAKTGSLQYIYDSILNDNYDSDEEMWLIVVANLQRLIADFVRFKPRVIKTLKKCHEDYDQSGGANRARNVQQNETGEMNYQNFAFEALLKIVSKLYFDRPDAGIEWWLDNHLRRFLKMVSDARSASLISQGFIVLASLSTGVESSHHAYNFMNGDQQVGSGGYITSSIPWTTLFRSLELSAQSLNQNVGKEMNPDEVEVLCSFLGLLKQVVKYSPIARVTLYESQHFRAINTLFMLLVCHLPVELKAALFLAISSFCIPVGAGSGIAAHVWQLLDQSQVLAFSNIRHSANAWQISSEFVSSEGIFYDLEETESQKQTYPETMAFLHLLNNLVQQNSNSEISAVSETLGANYRTPGILPYINFVVDRVLLRIKSRKFASMEEQWRMTEICLKIIENCLRKFDLKESIDANNNMNVNAQSQDVKMELPRLESPLLLNPRYALTCRLLSNSSLLKVIFQLIKRGVEFLNVEAKKLPAASRSIHHALKIVRFVLQNQQDFLEWVPSILESASLTLPSLTGLDHLMAYDKETIIQIALFVNCDYDMTICGDSIKIMEYLSKSMAFIPVDPSASFGVDYGTINRLVTLLDSSPESYRIIYGFCHLLGLETSGEKETETDPESDEKVDIYLGYDDYATSRNLVERLETEDINIVRLSILDFLISDLKVNRSSPPTLSHFLLGYNIKRPMLDIDLKDPNSPDAKLGCLNVILDLLRRGIGHFTTTEEEEEFEPLFQTHPFLAERCYELIFELCSSPAVSGPTMRYLRNRENFVLDQLIAMPVTQEPNFVETGSGRVVNRVWSSCLRKRTWTIKLIALELHMTSLLGQRRHTQSILEILLIRPMTGESTESNIQYQQPLTKIFEILNSLTFDVSQMDKYTPLNLRFFREADFDVKISNEHGNLVYDIGKIHLMLLNAFGNGERAGEFVSQNQRDLVMEEIRYILHNLLERNQRNELVSAHQGLVEAWCELVNVVVGRVYNLLPAESREEKVFDLLSTALPKVNSSHKITPSVQNSVSIVILNLLAGLRKDRLFQSVLQNATLLQSDARYSLSSRLSPDALHQIVLRNIIDAIIKPGTTEQVRGNYYASLVSYLLYTKADEVESSAVSINLKSSDEFNISPDSFSIENASSSSEIESYQSILSAGNLVTINGYGDRLLDIVCRDVSDGSDLWKTVSFVVLDALVDVTTRENMNSQPAVENRALNYMVKNNFLSHFVQSMRKDDASIRSVMISDPETLNSLYIFESKISLFLRIAQTKSGSERLVEAGIFEVLADFTVLDNLPDEVTVDIMDIGEDEMFFPLVHEKYQQILIPVLQLVNLICGNLGRSNSKVIAKVSKFITAHKDVFAKILRDTNQTVTINSLQILNLLTCLICFGATDKALMTAKISNTPNYSLQALVFSLLGKYLKPDRWLPHLTASTKEERTKASTFNGAAQFMLENESMLLFPFKEDDIKNSPGMRLLKLKS
ncbi:hypothetical protein HK098_004247 [Nowakowskiella sp. JEL0407]|nr:hypothetical protein HK098_004247 [Nowakowskiella sp. JEL0407]